MTTASPPEQRPGSPPGPDQQGKPTERAFDLLSLWTPIRKHWPITVATAVMITLAIGFWTMKQTKIYEASASLQFDPNPPRPLGGKVESVVEVGNGAWWDTREYYETQYQIIQSRRVAVATVQQLGLNRDFAFLYNLPKGVEPPAGLEPISEEDAADALRGRIRVEPVKQSRIATVKLTDADPDRGARVLNALIETYKEQNVELVAESTDDASQWLRQEHDKLKGELETSELKLHKYKEDNNILSIQFDDKSSMLTNKIGQLNTILTTIGTETEKLAARRNQLAKIDSNDPSVLPATELLQSGLLQNLRQQYVEAVREHASLLQSGLGRNNDEVKAAAEKVATTKDAVLKEVRNIQGALDKDVAAARQYQGSVGGTFESAKKEALELNLLEIEYNRLRRQKENTEKLYALLLERSTESDLTRRLKVNNVSVVDHAVVPKAPIRPNVPLNLALGAIVGIIVGVGAAFGRSALDRTIRTPDDVEQIFSGAFLGLIPEINETEGRKRKRRSPASPSPELIVHHSPMSGVAEAARSVRTNLLFMAPDRPYRVLLVTSAGPAEGKTTVASCIATAIAQTGKRVLLVDCDLRRPRIHRIFRQDGGDLGPGLTTAILEEGAADCVAPTDVPNLSVVPAGPIPPNPSELLQSERFRQLLFRLRDRFDLVILDSPPLVAVTDATILSTVVDGTVVVVRAFKTGKDLARHANRLLTDVGAQLAGVVLNAVNVDKDEYKYLYQYYRRGSYYSSDSSQPRVSDVHPPAPPPV